ncbi:group 1 glycosyl transferase [Rhodoplanes sp. Z2-YC6860]|nr:group 1 glycosyl transferase [Rhodoplanes sp. Z2-YC6860]
MNRSQRILYICDWLPPDFGAVGQYGVIWARKLASEGHDVTLAGLSSNGDSERSEAVGPGRYREIKLKTVLYDKTDTLRRLLWTIKTNNRLLWRLWREMRTADTILFTGSPPLLIHWMAPANLLLRKRLVYRITDFHPECAIAQRGSAGLLLNLLYRLTVFWRRRIDQFEVLGKDQIARLCEIGIPAERIELKRDSSPVAITQETLPLSRPNGAQASLLLLYSGNWGVAHDHRTFLEGYRLHHQKGTARFTLWLNATGSAVSAIEQALQAHDLPYVKGAPVPIEQLASLLVTPDAHLIALSDPFVGFVLPSKVYGCIESGKAVLFIGSEKSDVHLLCAKDLGPAYQRVEVGDADGCQRALDRLSALIDDGRPGARSLR